MIELPRVLCVDDEPQILQGLVLHLRRHFKVTTADGPLVALKMLEDEGPPAVIVSDMRMPGMDGATLLKRVLQRYPETTRILLTGEPSRDSAATAVNEGQIFRFLTKPCAPDELRAAVEAGVKQYHLYNAEKVLMQETLVGCINALIDVLAMTNPVAFGRTNRVKRMANELAVAVGAGGFWQLEAAAMLSQIGYISLPTELVEKLYYGKRLTPAEEALTAGAPRVAQALLGRIPRIERVMQILQESQDEPKPHAPDGQVKLGADLLRLVLAYDALIVAGHPVDTALQKLQSQTPAHSPRYVEALTALIGQGAANQAISEVTVSLLQSGMIILDDLRTSVGTLLVPKGFEVTDAFLERKRNFDSGLLQKRVRVMASAPEFKAPVS